MSLFLIWDAWETAQRAGFVLPSRRRSQGRHRDGWRQRRVAACQERPAPRPLWPRVMPHRARTRRQSRPPANEVASGHDRRCQGHASAALGGSLVRLELLEISRATSCTNGTNRCSRSTGRAQARLRPSRTSDVVLLDEAADRFYVAADPACFPRGRRLGPAEPLHDRDDNRARASARSRPIGIQPAGEVRIAGRRWDQAGQDLHLQARRLRDRCEERGGQRPQALRLRRGFIMQLVRDGIPPARRLQRLQRLTPARR